MRKLILFLLMFASAKLSAQVYQEMPQYGYRANRMAFDSTLQIPTVCGVPTLKSIVKTNKSGAIAYDSCNSRFYTYNPKTQTWSAVSGGNATDTTSLSNRINQRFDSLRRSNDSIFARKNGSFIFQYKDNVGTIPTLQQVTDAGNTTTNVISVPNLNIVQGVNTITLQNNNGNFLVINPNSNEVLNVSSNGIKFGYPTSYVEITTPSVGNVQLTSPETSGTIPISVNGITANSAGNITIPTSVAVDTIFRTLGKDSIFYKKNNITYAIKDSVGGASNDTAKVVIAQVHNATATTLLRGEVVYLFGATGNVASVKRANNKQDSTSSKTFGLVRADIPSGSTGYVTTQGQVEKLNLGSPYNEGDVLWLDSLDGKFTKVKPQAPLHQVFIGVVERANNGNGLAYIKPQNGVELDEVHDVQINNILNNQIIVYSDTQKVWKNRNAYVVIDTTNRIATKSNVALKLNISDTATLSNRINLKLNITDTSTLQSKSIPSYSILANNTNASANATAQQFRDTSGTYSGTITWTGTTAPSGATNHSYRLTQVGKCVTLHIALVFATNGAGLTAVQITLPSGAPTPVQPAGLTGASSNMYPANAHLSNSANTILSSSSRGFLRNNTTGNGFDILINFATSAPAQVGVTIQYWTN